MKESIKYHSANADFFSLLMNPNITIKKFVNIQIGKPEDPHRIYLFVCKIVNSANSDTMVELINNTILDYELNGDKMLLLISDAAQYMIKTGKILRKKYDKMFHITCFIHLIHNCVLKIKNLYGNIDSLIASVKLIDGSSHLKEKFPISIYQFHLQDLSQYGVVGKQLVIL